MRDARVQRIQMGDANAAMFPGTGGAVAPAGTGGGVVMTGAGGSSGGTSGQRAIGGSGGGAPPANGGIGSSGTGGMTGAISDAGTGGRAGTGGADGMMDSGAPGGGDAGGSEMTCPLPTTFKWTSSGPLASPKSPSGQQFVSLKDFTAVRFNNLYHVFATVYDQTVSGWNMVYFDLADWPEADAASQFYMQNTPTQGGVAPQIFYFTPKKKWVLVYQWGASFSTSDNLSQPTMWSPKANLLTGGPQGALDFTVICNKENCYLFFAGDNSKISSKMPINQFPSAFNGYTTLLSDDTNSLFEAPEVYSVAGTNDYLLIVEAIGSGGRYFRSFKATDLEGPWTPLQQDQTPPSVPGADRRRRV